MLVLKRCRLLWLDMIGLSTEVHVDEPVYRVEDVVEPSSSDAISSDPFRMVMKMTRDQSSFLVHIEFG